MEESLNIRKAAALIAYLAYRVDIGKTKLMKLLYLIDFTAYEKYGSSITGDTYRNFPLGNVPSRIMRKHEKFLEGLVDITVEQRGTDYAKYTALGTPNLEAFSKEEVSVIEEIIERFGNMSQEALVRLIHEEPLWKHTKTGERIPYYLAPLRAGVPAITQAERLAMEQDSAFIASIVEGFAEFRNQDGSLNFG